MNPNYPQSDPRVGLAKSQQMSRIESNLEDLNFTFNGLCQLEEKLRRHAQTLGYFHDDQPRPEAVRSRLTNIHEAVKNVQEKVESLNGFMNVFD